MTPDEISTMRAAIDRYVSDLSILTNDSLRELERARELRDRFAAAISADPHISDEDLVPEVIKAGDLLRVNVLEEIAAGSSTVLVRHVGRDPLDGSKVLIVAPAPTRND